MLRHTCSFKTQKPVLGPAQYQSRKNGTRLVHVSGRREYAARAQLLSNFQNRKYHAVYSRLAETIEQRCK